MMFEKFLIFDILYEGLTENPDDTKVTSAERNALEEAERDIAENGTISHDSINWD
ncbi:MAG: hypothetical protein K2K20_12390 [Lachnospiraceae bacterium]|nr:hypothetical protein [Lachnospiraceae bacterium]